MTEGSQTCSDPVTRGLSQAMSNLALRVSRGEFGLGDQFEPNPFRREVERLIQKTWKDRCRMVTERKNGVAPKPEADAPESVILPGKASD